MTALTYPVVAADKPGMRMDELARLDAENRAIMRAKIIADLGRQIQVTRDRCGRTDALERHLAQLVKEWA